MHFKRPAEGEQEETNLDVYLPPRALLLFTGEARYNWLHSIATRKVDKVFVNDRDPSLPDSDQVTKLKFRKRRISLTFRKVKTNGPCKCPWVKLCDSQNQTVAIEENLLSGEGGEAPVYKAEGN
mmetsp:Transcript_36966/g.56627  ORF Transcript_36966/g.56627 Transcript_36966/m.56627 type:complete len:124 (+) Transcript_36966:888-1259(+)